MGTIVREPTVATAGETISDRSVPSVVLARHAWAGSPAAEFLLRISGLLAVLVLAGALAPREIAIAGVVVAVGAVIAEATARAVLRGAGSVFDERAGADLAPVIVAMSLSALLIGGALAMRGQLAELLDTFEVGRTLQFAVPLAGAGAVVLVLAREVDGGRPSPRTFLVTAVALAVALYFVSVGKTIGALLSGALAGVATEGLLRLRRARLRPSRGLVTGCVRNLQRALRQLPGCLLRAFVRHADLFVAMAALGAETAGCWCIARAITLDLGCIPAGLRHAWRPGTAPRDPRRAVELALLPWWIGIALVAGDTLAAVLGPRWADVAVAMPWLAIAAVPIAIATALGRSVGGSSAGSELRVAACAACAAPLGFGAMVVCVAVVESAIGAASLVMSARRRPEAIVGLLLPTGIGVAVVALAVSGARDLLLALGSSGGELLLATLSVASIVHVAVAVGCAPSAPAPRSGELRVGA